MKWDRIETNWQAAKGIIKKTWGKLTDNDIDIIDGDRERLGGKLQALYVDEKDQVRREVEQWAEKARWN
ncbi:CsbD family protein [Methylobacterium fujisawaense]|uniref:CsbD family protein n=1 Tax=Methylobacterium fujisawaense TaxID=107400 RepID=UPI00313DB1A0